MRRRNRVAISDLGLVNLTKGCRLLTSFTGSTGVVLVGGAFRGDSGAELPVHFNAVTEEYEIEWSQ